MKHFTLFFLLAFSQLNAQHFQKLLTDSSGIGSLFLISLHPTPDSGYICSGNFNFSYGILIKVDRFGQTEWYREYSVSGMLLDVTETNDHGFATIGIDHNNRHMIIKTDSLGNPAWSFYRNNSGNAWPSGSIQAMSSGDILYSGGGMSNDSLFSGRVDLNGNFIWEKVYGTAYLDAYNHDFLCLTDDGGFVLAAKFGSQGGTALVKSDASGNIQWQKAVAPGYYTFAVKQAGTNYYLAGTGVNEHMVILTDSAGNPLWGRSWPLLYSGNVSEYPFSIMQEGDGLVSAGRRYYGMNNTPVEVIRFDTGGNLQWIHQYQETSINNIGDTPPICYTAGHSVSFIATASGGSSMFLCAGDSTGDVNCNQLTANFNYTPFTPVTGSATLSGYPGSHTWTNVSNTMVTRYISHTNICDPLSISEKAENQNALVFPSPADREFTIQLPAPGKDISFLLYDASGKCVRELNLPAFGNELVVASQELAEGIFYYRLESGGKIYSGKLLIIH